ncbi:MAG: hypothetical protein HYW26_05905 [Candidatus Aenigmarchaeota archaeon]|nr:hypothetical protein [Candidatus Aenigmarchaeota archaeon]
MRKAFVIALVASLFLSVVFAQNDTSGQQQAPPPDPCAGVSCNSPPAASCRGNSYITYSPGTCESSTGQCKYNEQATSCGETKKVCPDGFEAKCQQTCDAGSGCRPCDASCTGHEQQQTTTTQQNQTTAPPPSPPPQPPQNQTTTCPTPPAQPQCSSGAYARAEYDSKGCVTGYLCTPLGKTEACVTVITPATDAAGNCKEFSNSCLPPGWNKVDRCPGRTSTCGNGVCEAAESSVTCPDDCRGKAACGNNICEEGEADVTGGCGPGADPGCLGQPSYAGTCPSDCQRQECPVHPAPVCERGYSVSGSFDERGCRGPATCCGDSVCSGGENSQNCRQDCVGAEPDRIKCPDGSFAACRTDPRGGRFCEPCRVSEDRIPQGCRQEVEKETGFVKVVCEDIRRTCPEFSIPHDAKQTCEAKGGRFQIRNDVNGCSFPDCSFGESSPQLLPELNPLEQGKKCRSETEREVEATRKGCEQLGLGLVFSTQGGCRISKCSSKPTKSGCEPIPLEQRQRIEGSCLEKGLSVIKDFDESGCPLMKCGETSQCSRDLPKEAYEKCGQQGGEMIVRRDNSGCVSLSQCVVKGDIREADVESIEKIPESSDLLSMAFKMEELRIELDRLAKKTEDIANYYESTKSADEGRYRRVSNMFSAAKGKVDEIKTKLRDIVQKGTPGENDLIGVKGDIRYIKDVMMKDALYLMLSSSDDVNSIKESQAVKVGDNFEAVAATSDTECGSDGECFNRGFRLCKKLIFYPEGSKGPKVEVRGLEGDACIMYAVLPEGEGPPAGAIPGVKPPYDMTCKIKNYALGVNNPEKDIFPYCEGPMVELMKKYGTGGQNAPGVPGKCSGEECKDYCGRGPSEAKECLQYLGQYLPAEAKQGLEQLASGKGGGSGFGRREEFSEFEGGEFNQPQQFQQPQGQFQQPVQQVQSIQQQPQEGYNLCGDGICDDFERNNPTACQVDCRGGTSGGGAGGTATAAPQQQFQPPQGEQCSGCLSNNICDPGECSFCPDCRRAEAKPA